MSVIDSLFPGYAAKRAMARLEKKRADLMLTAMERRFEGAAGGRRNQGWRAAGADANTENGSALAVLRNRARDLRRNNPYAERAITGIADNVVGAGIVPRPLIDKDRQAKRLGDLWYAWGESLQCDADGLENFYGLQHKTSVVCCSPARSTATKRLSASCTRSKRTTCAQTPTPVSGWTSKRLPRALKAAIRHCSRARSACTAA